MASGIPLVAASAGALPETCGGAAVLVDPDDGEGFADALASLVTAQALHASLRQGGLERASAFTWERTAVELDRLLMAHLNVAPSGPPAV